MDACAQATEHGDALPPILRQGHGHILPRMPETFSHPLPGVVGCLVEVHEVVAVGDDVAESVRKVGSLFEPLLRLGIFAVQGVARVFEPDAPPEVEVPERPIADRYVEALLDEVAPLIEREADPPLQLRFAHQEVFRRLVLDHFKLPPAAWLFLQTVEVVAGPDESTDDFHHRAAADVVARRDRVEGAHLAVERGQRPEVSVDQVDALLHLDYSSDRKVRAG